MFKSPSLSQLTLNLCCHMQSSLSIRSYTSPLKVRTCSWFKVLGVVGFFLVNNCSNNWFHNRGVFSGVIYVVMNSIQGMKSLCGFRVFRASCFNASRLLLNCTGVQHPQCRRCPFMCFLPWFIPLRSWCFPLCSMWLSWLKLILCSHRNQSMSRDHY